MKSYENLNDLEIIVEYEDNHRLKDYSLQLDDAHFKKCEVYFKNVEEKLI